MTKEEQSKIIYDYQEYIEDLIAKEFYNEEFLKFLADQLGYELKKKEEVNE